MLFILLFEFIVILSSMISKAYNSLSILLAFIPGKTNLHSRQHTVEINFKQEFDSQNLETCQSWAIHHSEYQHIYFKFLSEKVPWWKFLQPCAVMRLKPPTPLKIPALIWGDFWREASQTLACQTELHSRVMLSEKKRNNSNKTQKNFYMLNLAAYNNKKVYLFSNPLLLILDYFRFI